MRGEDCVCYTVFCARAGSSPHARGGLFALRLNRHRNRLIPACAGRTKVLLHRSLIKQAHPRMRGEDQHLSARLPAREGSSPHARGGHYHLFLPGMRQRLIPACAGRTMTHLSFSASDEAHPRMRGEDFAPLCRQPHTAGSSPHARGGQNCLFLLCGQIGLIPACAGRTISASALVSEVKAHPRMRGEDKGLLRAVRPW